MLHEANLRLIPRSWPPNVIGLVAARLTSGDHLRRYIEYPEDLRVAAGPLLQGRSSMARALVSGTRGWRFESSRPASSPPVQQPLDAVVERKLLLHIVVAHLLQCSWVGGEQPVQKRPFSGHHDHDSNNLRLRPGQQGRRRSRRLWEKPIGRSPVWMPAKTAEVKQERQNSSRVGRTTRDHRVSALSLGCPPILQ